MSLADRFPTFARHWAMLRASLALEREADKTRRSVSDHEFLPAALEIMEKPPSPGLRWLTLTLCALFGAALLWSVIGKVDVVAVATGKVVPTANVKLIQPIELGAVRAIHVRNGQHVRRGQLLIELDSTLTAADEAQATQGLRSATVIAARNTALLGHLSGGDQNFAAPEGTTAEVARTQDRFVATSIAEYEAQRASLLQSKAESAAARTGAEAEVAKLGQTLPFVEQQLAARRELSRKGYFSKIRLLEYEQLRVEHVQNIAVKEADAAKARAAMANYDAQIARLRETFGKTAVTDLSEAQDKSTLAAEELRKTTRRRELQQLRAPVDGTVQQLSVATIGGVVEPAKPIMVIVPDDAAIEVEAQILNKDIGFVREGQAVRVKLEAYPFTDYGLIEGRVESISRDAIDYSQQGAGAARDTQGRPPPTGLVYAARIRLDQRRIRVGNGWQPIGPGLSVQAEIKTGERRIIQYLLSPIAQTMDEAGRER